ncbi:MAG: nicotinamide mononucleotide transporter [Bacteroidales bacterium]|jgi:nicotinamide mononucleotide transporter|nr:nicotinamide mononucleotide transporter [Bacteroidales bacterium]
MIVMIEEYLQMLVNWFSIDNVLFEFLGQRISSLEVTSTVCGLLCVLLAVKGKVANFWVGYIYNIVLFLMFYQKRAYSSMMLQPVSLAINFFGHYRWTHPHDDEKDEKSRLKVTTFNFGQRSVVTAIILIFTFVWGYILSRVDVWIPSLFPAPAKMPYFDAFILGTVLMAQLLSAQKKLDCWVCWLVANSLNIILCYRLGLSLMTLVYALYFLLAIGGFLTWLKMYRKQHYIDLRRQVEEKWAKEKK